MFSGTQKILTSARNFSFFRASTPLLAEATHPHIPKAAFLLGFWRASTNAKIGIALSIGLTNFLAEGCRQLGYSESSAIQFASIASAYFFGLASKVGGYLAAENELGQAMAEVHDENNTTPHQPRHARRRPGIMG